MDAPALAALVGLLTQYESWLTHTEGPQHRREVETHYLALVPADAALVDSLRFDALGLLPEALRRRGEEDKATPRGRSSGDPDGQALDPARAPGACTCGMEAERRPLSPAGRR